MRKRKQRLFSNYKLIILSIFLLLLLMLLFLVKFDVYFENQKFKSLSAFEILFLKNELLKEIFENNPEIIKIDLIYDFKNLKVFLKPITENPVAIICSSKCFYLGEHGYIYEIKNENNKNLLPIISYREIYPNSYLDPKITSALSYIFEYSNIAPLPLKRILIMTNKDLKIETKNFSFLIDPYKDVQNQLKKLQYVLKNSQNINYSQIDLRIPGRIYLK
jgi:hypothetical protein